MTRSASVMIPTQRPPSLTTGTPVSSFLLRTRMTSSTLVSGATVTGSESMISATVGTGRSLAGGASAGQRVDHVGRDHALGPDALRREAARAGMQEHACAGCRERFHALRQH